MTPDGGGVISQYDASPEATLAAVSTYEGTVLVDFDETLYLRNSTEDFINCARPVFLALLLLRALDGLRPWRITGSDTRDTWRVCAISLIFPWTRWIWHTKVPGLVERHVNRALRAALNARTQPPVVLTVGFKSVVAPLLAAMGFADAPIVAARMTSFADRRLGKLHMATRVLGAETVRRSMVVTDSANDLDVLRSCARPLRTVWPEARYKPAFAGVYLPGQYISQVKRPGSRYIWRSVLQEDYAVWLLSSIGLAVNPAAHVTGLLLLLLSFWAIYERGYVENDLAALRYETDPKLSANFGRLCIATPALQPWLWSLPSGAAGVGILHPNLADFVAHFAAWIAILLLTYTSFYFYNRLDKQTRIWLYPVLQFWRCGAFAAIVPVEPIGIAAVGALLMARWMPYVTYRLGNAARWPNAPSGLLCLVSFLILSAIVACSLPISTLLTWGALALLLWSVFRARGDICVLFKAARRLDRARH